MEESGVSKVISVRLENEEYAQIKAETGEDEHFEEEDVEAEEGRELPPGVDDPSLVSEAELRPIRSGLGRVPVEEAAPAKDDAPADQAELTPAEGENLADQAEEAGAVE
jgi:chromosome segregation protein